MILTVNPVKRLSGRIHLPASKSYSIRSFIIAACGGTSTIKNPSDCEDALVSMRVARCLGAKLSKTGANTFRIKASNRIQKKKTLDVNESGTTLRFLLPLLSLHFKSAKVIGKGTLRGRPNFHLNKTLRKMGMDIKGRGKEESIPINFKGGQLKGGRTTIDGSLSSQFISALLITCPRLDIDSYLHLKGKRIVSTPYIEMTQNILRLSGIKAKRVSNRKYSIKGRQSFKGIKNFTVPSDYGLAAFLIAAAAINDSSVELSGNFNDRFNQADKEVLNVFRKMGVTFLKRGQSIWLKGPFKLKGGSFSLQRSPDSVPVVAVLSLFAKGRTRIYDIGHVRTKESDRILDLRKELLKLGAKVTEKRNELVIYPQEKYKKGVLLDPHNDHRLAMAFCALGSQIEVRVKDIECIAKSYPCYLNDLKHLGAKLKKSK